MFEVKTPTLLKNEKLGIDFEKQSIISQAIKIHEEYHEVMQEIYGNQHSMDYKRIASEALDLTQATKQLLFILNQRGLIDIKTDEKEHTEKLQHRGWELEKEYKSFGGD